MNKYFIILRHPNGHPLPIVDENENVALFKNKSAAEDEANSNTFAQAFGYEIFSWDGDE